MNQTVVAVVVRCLLLLAAGPLVAQLPPSARDVDLRVVDAKGGPIQDLQVRALGALPGGPRCLLLPEQVQRTLHPRDFTGDHARLEGLPDGDLVLLVEADGCAMTLSKVFTLPAKARVRLTVRMLAGVTLEGTLTSPEGAPVADTQVRILAREVDNPNPFVQLMSQRFVLPVTTTSIPTAQDGSFRLANVAPGDYVLRATHAEWADARLEVIVKAKDKGTKDLGQLKFVPGGVVAGVVQRNGKRLANAVVLLQSKPGAGKDPLQEQAVRIEVETDAEGNFVFPRVPFGTYQLAGYERGDLMAQARQQTASQRTIELKARSDGTPQQELLLLKDQ